MRAVSLTFSPRVAAAPTGISNARWACRPKTPNRAAAVSRLRSAVRVACLVVRRASRVVRLALAVADRWVRRAEALVAEALRLVEFRLRVAAARLAAAERCDGVCVAIGSVLLEIVSLLPFVPTQVLRTKTVIGILTGVTPTPYTSPLAEELAPDLLERLMRYVRIDTQSRRDRTSSPST